MKTTVEISDGLMEAGRRIAAREGTTLRALIEEGLRHVLDRRKSGSRTRFRLRNGSVGGKGLQPGVADGSWERIREVIYHGRGE